MAVKILFVDPMDEAVLRKYLAGNDGVALVFPDAIKAVASSGVDDGDVVDYSFDSADVMVECVYGPDHYMMEHLASLKDD